MWLRTLRTWLTRRQSPIQTRKKIAARRRAKPMLEILEVRLAPAVVSYNSSSNELDFTAVAGKTIIMTAPGSNQIEIQVTSDTITLGGDASGNANFSGGGTSTLTISNVNQNSGVTIGTFNVYLANHQNSADTLTFGLGTSSGVQNVNIGAPAAIPAVPQTDTYDTVTLTSLTIGDTLNLSAGTIAGATNLPTGAVNLTAGTVVLAAGGSGGSIGPLTTNIGQLTATTTDGSIAITNLGSGPLTVNSIVADQGGQGPTVNTNQTYGAVGVVYNSTPNSTPTYLAGSSNVTITSAGPIALNSISATGNLTVEGEYIVEGNGASQAIDAQNVDLDAIGAVHGPVQAPVTFTPNATGDTMALPTTGPTWTSLGFAAGGLVTVTGDANAANDGTFTIASISLDGFTLTLTVSNVLTSESSANVGVGTPLSVTFSGGNTMANTGPTWTSLGFTQGGQITVAGAANPANDGTFTIATITGNTLTLTTSPLQSETAEVAVGAGAAGNYQGQVTFANSATGDTLTLPSTGPTWTALGFLDGTAMAGDPLVLSGASQTTNDATFTIASVSGYTLTLQQSFALAPETESASVSNGMIGMASSPNSTSTTPTAIDVAETDGFTATTTNGNIYLAAGGQVNSTAVDVVAGGTGNVSVTSSASSLTIQNITANGATVTGGGSAPLGGTAAVTASQGSLAESGSPGTITAQIVSLTSAQNIGTAASPFVTSAASGVTVNETATSPSAASVYVKNTSNLSSVAVSTDDGTVAIYQNNSTATPLLSFKNNHLLETGSVLVTFANTDTSGGLANNVILNGTINAAGISAGGQILANNGSTLIEDTVLPGLTLSAGNGIGNPTNTIPTEVTQLYATTKSGGIFVNNQPISGTGATVSFTASNGSITSVTGATGSGYPVNSVFDLLVTGGGGTGGVVQVMTNATGNIAAFVTSPVAGGSGYSSTSGASTSNVLLLTATITTPTQNGTINVTDAGNIYLQDQTNSKGISRAAAISTSPTGTSGTVTLDATGNIYNPSGVKAGIATVATGTLALTANGVSAASNSLQTSVTGLTLASAIPGGLFLSNSAALTVTPTVAAGNIGGDVSIATDGDLTLNGSMTGNNVTLTAQGGALTSTSATTLTATGALTLTAQQIGDSSAYSPDGPAAAATEVLQTNATTINAEANYGGIYISNASTSPLTLTAGAVGPEPTPGVPTNNIEIYSKGSIVIDPQKTALTSLSGPQAVGVFSPSGGTATLVAGATLSYNGATTTPGVSSSTITSNTTLTTANSGKYYDVEASTLSIDGATVPTSTAATGTSPGTLYGPLVVQTNTPGIPVSGSQTVVAPLELTAADLASGGTFTGSSIIIDNLGVADLGNNHLGVSGQPGVLTIANSLTLNATNGSVVFLNPNDTIVVTGAGNTITIHAGTATSSNGTISTANSAATSNDVTVLGNLQTNGGNINISAVGNVSIGKINAGSGHVYLTSLTGSILSSNGTALAITGATILRSAPQLASGAQSASLVQLNATQAIAAATQAVAAYDAAVAQANADLATATALQAELSSLTFRVNADTSTAISDKKANDTAQAQTTYDTNVLVGLTFTYDTLELASAIVGEVGAALGLAAGAADAVPIVGPTAASPLVIAAGVLALVSGGLTIAADVISFVIEGETVQYNNDSGTSSGTQNTLDVDQARLNADTDSQTAVTAASASVQADLTAEQAIVKADAVIVTAAQIASAQATAAVIGAASPLPLTVAGPVTISDQGSGASGGSIIVNTPITVAAPSGAQVSFTATTGTITSVNPTPAAGGTGYPASSTFDLTVTGGAGGVVQATTNASGNVISFAATPLAAGSGYSTATGATTDPSTVVATTGSGAQVSYMADGGVVTSVNPTPVAGGTGYPASSTFNLTVTSGGGSGAIVQATTDASGTVTAFSLLTGGSGFPTTDPGLTVGGVVLIPPATAVGTTDPFTTVATSNPSTVVATTGSGAQLSFTAAGGVITSVASTPAAGGTGYPASSTFDLAVTGGGGTGGVVQATTNGSGVVTSFSLVTGGSGYTTPGTTTGSTGSGAQVSFSEAGGIITSVASTPAAGGTGYPHSSTFDLMVTGGSGGVVQATTNSSGVVTSFSLVDGGVGYTGTTTDLAGVTIYANSPLTVSANITAPGAIELTADSVVIPAGTTIDSNSTITITGDASDAGGASVTVAGTLNAQSALIDMDASSPGYDTFNITPSATTPITVTGVGTDNILNLNALGRTVTISETLSGDTITVAGMQPVMITNIAFANITNGAGVNFARLAQGGAAFTLNSVPLSVSGLWVNQVGSFTISGTKDTAQSSTSLATINGISNAANEAVGLTINTLTTGEQAGLVARYSGSGLANMYYGSIKATSANTYTASISLYVNGASTTLFSQNYTGTATGETLEFDVVGDSLQLFLNGSLVAYANDSTFAAGGVGMLTSGGAVVVSNFNAAPIAQQTASNNAYSDTFSSQGSSAITSFANGQLDDYWVNQYGDFTTGGTGTATASTTTALATVNGTDTATNEAVSLTISSLSTGAQVGLVARYSGSGLANMYYGSIMATSASTYTASISLNVNGTSTQLFSQNYTGTATGKTLEFDVVGDSLQLFLNGSIVAYANDSTFAAGSVGMLTSGGAVVVSNFNAAPIPQQSDPANTYSDTFSSQGQDAITSANNGQLDDYWVNQDGYFTTSGTGTATGATSIALATVNGSSTATNEAVSLTINTLTTGEQVGLVARYSGSGLGNMYSGSIMATSANAYTAYIDLYVNGAKTTLFSQNYTGSVSTAVLGKTLEFDVVGSSLQLSLNGSIVAYANDSTFATGSVGMLTSGGPVVVSNFNAAPIMQQTASNNVYSDNFMTANNGQLDDYWFNQFGAFTTAGTGTATAVSSVVSLATVNGLTYSNEAVSLTISALATGQQVGLVGRYNGSGVANMYYGSIVATSKTTYTAYIYREVNGVGTSWVQPPVRSPALYRATYHSSPSTLEGDTLEFDLVGSSLELFLNGSLVAYANDSTFATGGVGMLTTGGAVVVSNFNAAPITQQSASNNAYSDTFSSQGSSAITSIANGQLDDYWVNQNGNFTTGGTGTATAVNSVGSLATVNGISNANEAVDLKINTLTTGEQAGLVARYSGSGLANMYYGSIMATSADRYTANIYLYVNGASTTLISQKYKGTPPSGQTLEFDVAGDSLQLFLNGSLVAYANDSTFTTGSVGMLTSGGAVVVSNFNAAPITQQMASNPFTDTFSTQGQDAITSANNGQLDDYWVNQYGDFATSGTGTATGSTSIALATVNGISTQQTASNPFTDTFSTQGSYANEAVSLTISSLPTGKQVGLVARYNGSGLANMYYGSIVATSANTYTASIYLIVNGASTSLVRHNYTGTVSTAVDGQTLEFNVDGRSLQLYLGGSLVANAFDSTFTTGGVGMLTSGGQVVVRDFNASATRGASYGQLDDYWVNQYGAFTTSGTGTATAATSIALATVNGISNANEAVDLTISSLATGQQVGLVARYNGSGLANMYFGEIVATSSTTYTAYIYRNVNGVGTSLYSATYQDSTSTLNGDTLEFDVVGSSLQLFVNGSLVAYASDSTFATGGVGMLTSGGAVVVSNFNAAPITQQTASHNAYSDNFSTQGQSALTGSSNGQLDDYWANQYGDFQVNTTNQTATALGSLSLATVNGISNANEAVSLTIDTLETGEQVGLVARDNGSGLANLYYGSSVATPSKTYTASIYMNVDGIGTSLFSATYSGSASTALDGKTLEFDVVGSSLQLFLNGSIVAYANNSTFATGGVGMLTSGGAVVVSNFNAVAITPPTASYPFSIAATGTSPITGLSNGQLNSYWSIQSGDYVDNAGTLTGQSSGVNLATVNGVSKTTENVSATITLTPGQYAGVVTRYTGPGVQNMYFGEIVAGSGTYTANIYLIVNGVWTQLDSQTYSGSVTGAVLKFAVSGTSLTLKLNSTTVATATDSTLTGAGSVGILSSDGATISSFSAD